MPAIGSLTVNDRQPTPVAHTFVPRSSGVNDLATFFRSGVVPIGEEVLTMSSRFSAHKYRKRMKLIMPVLETATVNGTSRYTVVRNSYFDGTFTFEDTSTQQERDDMEGLVANLLTATQPMVRDWMVKLESHY